MGKRAKGRKRSTSAYNDSIECFEASCAFTSEVQVESGDLRQVGLSGAPMGPLATSAVLAYLNLAASDQPENIRSAVNSVHDVWCASLTIHVGLRLRPIRQLAMVHHQIVRVHDAAGKNAINENLIRIEHFVTFRGIYDGLEPDRPLLKVKVCMLADTQITRATSIPKSDFDEVIDTIVQRLVHIGVQLMRNRALGTGAL
jgi:hypothetical protein